MKTLTAIVFTLVSFTSFAQSSASPKDKKEISPPIEAQEEKQTEETKSNQDIEFERGPYKDGQYQYFGPDELKKREEEQEKQQQ